MPVMRRYLTEPQQAQLLARLKALSSLMARRDRAWISLLMKAGMRITEFSLMTVGDAKFALQVGWLHIPKEHRKGWNRKQRADGKVIQPPKDHELPVTQAIRADLEELLRLQRECGGSGADAEPLVLSREGTPLSVRAYQERMDHWSRQCGIDASPHFLRHTAAKNVVRRTTHPDPRKVVQNLLGHADIRSSGIYTEIDQEEFRQALEEVHSTGRRLPKRKVAAAYQGRTGA